MIKTPVNQVRMTNVAVIKYKTKSGKKFEIACYKNKAINWRNQVENDINEVLQIDKIFTNVATGTIAKKKELKEEFGTDKEEEIIKKILDKGELQISDLERDTHLTSLSKDIANIICEKCVNSTNLKPFPVSMILKALDDIKFSANPSHSAKKQALSVIKDLQKILPIQRAKMRIKITTAQKNEEIMRQLIQTFEKDLTLEKEEKKNDNIIAIALAQPHVFRDISSKVEEQLKGSVEVIDQYVKNRAQEEEKAPIEEEKKHVASENEVDESHKVMVKTPGPKPKQPHDKKIIQCTSCKGSDFEDVKALRAHYKTDWHAFNLQKRMENLPSATLEEYENIKTTQK